MAKQITFRLDPISSRGLERLARDGLGPAAVTELVAGMRPAARPDPAATRPASGPDSFAPRTSPRPPAQDRRSGPKPAPGTRTRRASTDAAAQAAVPSDAADGCEFGIDPSPDAPDEVHAPPPANDPNPPSRPGGDVYIAHYYARLPGDANVNPYTRMGEGGVHG